MNGDSDNIKDQFINNNGLEEFISNHPANNQEKDNEMSVDNSLENDEFPGITNDDDVDLSGMGDDDDVDVNSVNLWGGLEGDEIIANLVNGVYRFKLDKIDRYYSAEKDTHSIIFSWSVSDEESDFFGITFSQWYTVYPSLAKDVKSGKLAGKDKAQAYQRINYLKDNMKRIGMSESEINAGNWDVLQSYVGTERIIEVLIKEDGYASVRSMKEIPGQQLSDESDGFSLS